MPDHLPEEVRRKFTTAEKLYFLSQHDGDLFDSAGTAYRTALELALKHLDDNSDKNLNWRINHLVKNQVLVKPMGNFAHRIRVLGNQGTHSDISFAELGELRLFTQLFLQYTFTLPAMIPNVAQVTGVVG